MTFGCCYWVGWFLKVINGDYEWFMLWKHNGINNAQIQNTVKLPLKIHRHFVRLQCEHLTLSWSFKSSCYYHSSAIWIFFFSYYWFLIPTFSRFFPSLKGNHMSYFRCMKALLTTCPPLDIWKVFKMKELRKHFKQEKYLCAYFQGHME